MTPLVTVVVPTYNRPRFLREALASLVGQSFRDFEAIVADDASGPETAAVVAEFADPRLRHRRNERNLGMLQNNLTAFRQVRTKYVASLHDDDRWREDLLERLVPPLERDDELVAAFSDHHVMDVAGHVDEQASEAYSRHWGRDRLSEGVHRPFHGLALVRQSTALAIAGVIRNSAMDWSDVPDEVSTVYDLWLSYLASRGGAGAYYCPERLAYYRQHDATETVTGAMRVSQAGMFVRERFLADPRLAEHRREFKRQYAASAYGLGIALLRSGRRSEARRALVGGLRRHPTPRGLAAYVISLESHLTDAFARGRA
jgi:glycosyltransferase involved in cell wall biosynthesis